ncbi:MAG: tellurite resistance TerB family protein [Alphaproteobacteria bacterium]|nr:tellurite resistance TerB family protein [Alphaproteobacteria bacterium]
MVGGFSADRLLGQLLKGGLSGMRTKRAAPRRRKAQPKGLVNIQLGGGRGSSTARAIGALATLAGAVLQQTLGGGQQTQPTAPRRGARKPGVATVPTTGPTGGWPGGAGKGGPAGKGGADPGHRGVDIPPLSRPREPFGPAPARSGSVPTVGAPPAAPSAAKPGTGWSMPGREAEASAKGAAGASAIDPEEAEALLMIRAMIAAAKSDGAIDAEERAHLAGKLEDAGLGEAERDFILRDFETPLDLEAIAQQVTDPMLAAQLYAASVVAVGDPSAGERAYLGRLAERLRLAPEVAAEIEKRLTGGT